MRTIKEWQEIKNQRQFTRDEREELFGDVNFHNQTRYAYNETLIDRYNKGLPLSKPDTKEAKRLIRAAR